MNEIKNASCVHIFITITPVSKVKRKDWGANIIVKQIDDLFYIYTCKLTRVNKYIQHHMQLYTTDNLKYLEKVAMVPLLITEKCTCLCSWWQWQIVKT